MNIFGICAAIICAAIIAIIIKQYKPEMSVMITLCVTAGALLVIMPFVDEIFFFIKKISAVVEENGAVKPLIKALGTAFVAELSYDICYDCGEAAMAKKIELAGKIAIIIISLPLANEFLRIISGLLK